MRGRGLLVCNEINPKRAKILASNIERLGIANALVLNEHPQRLEMRFAGWFDKILVDAPCSCPGLTQKELELLPLGAKTMTMECGVRFLTDYLDGDHYFAIHREGQNLDRARTQFKLVADMEKKWNDMQKIVAEEKEN